MEARYNMTLPRDFAKLALKCGKPKHVYETVAKALRQSDFTVGVYDDDDDLIAFGRICGDGSLYYLVCDLMIDPEWAGHNLEHRILNTINDYFQATGTRDSRVLAFVDSRYQDVCRTYGYRYLDTDDELLMCK